jgi:hypothetical protein
MSRNGARDFTARLYARIPEHYRAYDAERGLPLLALITVVAAQVANLRQDLDSLWDDFFIETCADWVVPYIGALVGTNLLQKPVGQSNRLDVWNTVLWRRSKGTPTMLAALGNSISGWLGNLAEFFQTLGWSQNLNRVRLDRPLTPALRDPARVGLLGSVADPFAHAADFKPAGALDQSRLMAGRGAVAAWGTPGRYQIRNLGMFVRRLQPFPVRGSSPSSAAPGGTPAANNTLFKFDPLFRDVPLFAVDDGASISRSAFGDNPWRYLGGSSPSIAVKQFGISLVPAALPSPPSPPTGTGRPFQFGAISPLALDAASGIRILADPHAFQLGSLHFVIGAQWNGLNSAPATPGTSLGAAGTLAFSQGKQSFVAAGTGTGSGQLAVTVQLGRTGAGFGTLLASPPGRFPGAVVAIRAARIGAPHMSDALYVYLPPSFVAAGSVLTYFAGADGSTYTDAALTQLACASEGAVYPAFSGTPSVQPASTFSALNRRAAGMVVPDPARFGAADVIIEAALYTGTQFEVLGAMTTAAVAAPATAYPALQAPTPWPAFTCAPAVAAVNGTLPASGVLTLLIQPNAPNTFIPASEVVLMNRAGQSLLVYLPEVASAPAAGVRVLVAGDGSTYYFNPSVSFNQASLARASVGQVLPIPGIWPLQQRFPVARNLCRVERTALLSPGQLGIDPEFGHFALPASDPALALGGFSVDFVEAFSDTIGATAAHAVDTSIATRWIAQSGDSAGAVALGNSAPVHTSLADAILNARDFDVIEIVDSATYAAAAGVTLANAPVKNLTIRAAGGQRPCFTFYSGGAPVSAALSIATPMDSLSLRGILLSGGPLVLQSRVGSLAFTECSLDPTAAPAGSLLGQDTNPASNSLWVLSRCITGGIMAAAGVAQITVTDSIVDRRGMLAIAGLSHPSSPPGAFVAGAAATVQLERVTVFGQISCQILKASESLLDEVATVLDQQSGCVRFTRFERGSVLPRRYQCIPDETQLQSCQAAAGCIPPLFNSRIFGRPEYAQLAGNCSKAILTAGEDGAEAGVFAGRMNTIRLSNLRAKFQEFMPVGLTAVVVAES